MERFIELTMSNKEFLINTISAESIATSVPFPIAKNINDRVISATINKQGSFKFIATEVGDDTTLSQIINLVNEANETKAPIARIADKIAAIFVPTVIIISIITFIIWKILGYNFEFALNMMISVLVISCPCPLDLASKYFPKVIRVNIIAEDSKYKLCMY